MCVFTNNYAKEYSAESLEIYIAERAEGSHDQKSRYVLAIQECEDIFCTREVRNEGYRFKQLDNLNDFSSHVHLGTVEKSSVLTICRPDKSKTLAPLEVLLLDLIDDDPVFSKSKKWADFDDLAWCERVLDSLKDSPLAEIPDKSYAEAKRWICIREKRRVGLIHDAATCKWSAIVSLLDNIASTCEENRAPPARETQTVPIQ